MITLKLTIKSVLFKKSIFYLFFNMYLKKSKN